MKERAKEKVKKSVQEKMDRGRMPRRKGEFTFRGRSIEELRAMSLEQVADLLTARARRKLRRGLAPVERKFLQEFQDPGASPKTHLRRMVVLPPMVGHEVHVYTGKQYARVTIAPEMVGHYLGELALTRGRVKHGAAGIGATRSSKFIPLK